MGAQIQLIMTVKILQPLAQRVLRQLQKLIEKKRPSSWFAIYLCLFVLLHSCALFTSAAKDRARKHGLDVSACLFGLAVLSQKLILPL